MLLILWSCLLPSVIGSSSFRFLGEDQSFAIISNSEICWWCKVSCSQVKDNAIALSFFEGKCILQISHTLNTPFLHKTYGIGVTTEKSLILNCSVRQTSNLTTLHTFNTPFLHKTYGIGVTTEKSLILNFSVRQTSKNKSTYIFI